MRAGRLRHQVILQSRSTTPNDYNEPVVSWSAVGTYRAAIEPVTGRERFASAERVAEGQVRIIMRYVGAITEENRIVHGSTVYDIKAVVNKNEIDREYELICQKGVDDG